MITGPRPHASLRACFALCASLLVACRPDPAQVVDEGSNSAATDPAVEGSGEPAAAPVDAVGFDRVAATQQACATSADCRVVQPSDWSARVECCYEYPCDLDYIAINQSSWERLRAWQLSHPFDCAAHLQSDGPCDARPSRCGLDQEPPRAECVDGVCQVAWPSPWPRVDGDAQTCAIASDCRPWRTSATSLETRCCEADCGTDWVAINEQTRDELAAWIEAHPVDCDATVSSGTCAERSACATAAPGVACVAGLCAVR